MSGWGPPVDRSSRRTGAITFSEEELRDLGAAWIALGVAFAIFFGGGSRVFQVPAVFLELLIISLITAGIGFLLHELAHKVVAIRFGKRAFFKANYPMLGIAVAAALAGFIFAAPGAVYHQGRSTVRENGLIAVAGPVTNIVLGLAFVPFVFMPWGLLAAIGTYGVLINFFLAAFNMLPFGPLDGNTVSSWSWPVFGITMGTSLVLLATAVVLLFL